METLRDYVNWGLTHCDKTGSVEGVPLVMENCVKNKKMKQLEIYGNSVQNGTPSPEAPVEVESVGEKCTKNLFDVEEFETQLRTRYILNDSGAEVADAVSSYSTYKIPIRSGETIYINGWFQRYYIYDANGVLLHRSSAVQHGSRMKTPYTPTADGYIGFQIYNSNWQNNKGTEQVEKGSVATEYEPYGRYKVPIVVKGKNLVDHSVAYANNYSEYSVLGTSYTIRGNVGTNSTDAPAGQLMFPALSKIAESGIDVQKGKTYTLSFDYLLMEQGVYSNRMGLLVYGTSNVVRHQNLRVSGTMGETISCNFSFTSGYDEKIVVCFRINNNYVTISNIQFEEGATATEYEPYTEPVTTNLYLNEPLRKIGDYADVLDFKNKKVLRKIHEPVFDGSEDWKHEKLHGGLNNFYLRIDGGIPSQSVPVMCNIGRYYDGGTLTVNYACALRASRNFNFLCNEYSDTSSFKSKLSELNANGTPMTVDFVLQGSTEEPIECELPTLTAKTSIVEIGTTVSPSNIKGKYIKR